MNPKATKTIFEQSATFNLGGAQNEPKFTSGRNIMASKADANLQNNRQALQRKLDLEASQGLCRGGHMLGHTASRENLKNTA